MRRSGAWPGGRSIVALIVFRGFRSVGNTDRRLAVAISKFDPGRIVLKFLGAGSKYCFTRFSPLLLSLCAVFFQDGCKGHLSIETSAHLACFFYIGHGHRFSFQAVTLK